MSKGNGNVNYLNLKTTWAFGTFLTVNLDDFESSI